MKSGLNGCDETTEGLVWAERWLVQYQDAHMYELPTQRCGAPGGIFMAFDHFEPASMTFSCNPRGHDP